MSWTISRASLMLASTAALFLAPGCISLLPETEPNQLYRLSVPISNDSIGPAEEAVTVTVNRLAAPRGLAGDRIAVQRDSRIGYMAGAAWLGPAPQMLHSMILDVFHAEHPEIAAARAEDGVLARYQLDLELRHFEAVYDAGEGGAPLVRVAIRARMIDREDRSVAGARTVRAERRATDNRQGAIVAAFSSASQAAASDLVGWSAQTVCAQTPEC